MIAERQNHVGRCFFFFSSRRRHTRCSRDWSSDVCSSDLVPAPTRRENPRLAQWKEAREVFPIYLALAKQQEIDIPFPQATRNLPEQPDTALFTQVHEWLEAMD